jgi:phosphoglycerate kinase
VHFVADWFDIKRGTITPSCSETVHRAEPGEFVLLENTRRYPFERALWRVDPGSLERVAGELDRIAVAFCSVLGGAYLFDAIAASNLDWSSTVLPLYMDRIALADEIRDEFRAHIEDACRSEVIIFSGAKMDKLDDLEEIVNHDWIKLVIIGGAIAMPFVKASTEKGEASLGLAENEMHRKEGYFVSAERVTQARRILTSASEQGIEVVLPVDFALDDGSVRQSVPQDRLQFDAGPQTLARIEAMLLSFLEKRGGGEGVKIFYNGVFGKFEDDRFGEGTRRMIRLLKTLTDRGAKTYVGGGEGLIALQKYGAISWVTHAFTAGGTILKAMSGRPISYLRSLQEHTRSRASHRMPL